MKERPILFSTAMVQAILNGQKTQTRRLVKPQAAILTDNMARALGIAPPKHPNPPVIPCPYGQAGDRLWVRETYAVGDNGQAVYRAEGDRKNTKWKPSIFLPRNLSRITLEITGIGVERVCDISHSDALAEGFSGREAFLAAFARLNPKARADAWVWVIRFAVVEQQP